MRRPCIEYKATFGGIDPCPDDDKIARPTEWYDAGSGITPHYGIKSLKLSSRWLNQYQASLFHNGSCLSAGHFDGLWAFTGNLLNTWIYTEYAKYQEKKEMHKTSLHDIKTRLFSLGAVNYEWQILMDETGPEGFARLFMVALPGGNPHKTWHCSPALWVD